MKTSSIILALVAIMMVTSVASARVDMKISGDSYVRPYTVPSFGNAVTQGHETYSAVYLTTDAPKKVTVTFYFDNKVENVTAYVFPNAQTYVHSNGYMNSANKTPLVTVN